MNDLITKGTIYETLYQLLKDQPIKDEVAQLGGSCRSISKNQLTLTVHDTLENKTVYTLLANDKVVISSVNEKKFVQEDYWDLSGLFKRIEDYKKYKEEMRKYLDNYNIYNDILNASEEESVDEY